MFNTLICANETKVNVHDHILMYFGLLQTFRDMQMKDQVVKIERIFDLRDSNPVIEAAILQSIVEWYIDYEVKHDHMKSEIQLKRLLTETIMKEKLRSPQNQTLETLLMENILYNLSNEWPFFIAIAQCLHYIQSPIMATHINNEFYTHLEAMDINAILEFYQNMLVMLGRSTELPLSDRAKITTMTGKTDIVTEEVTNLLKSPKRPQIEKLIAIVRKVGTFGELHTPLYMKDALIHITLCNLVHIDMPRAIHRGITATIKPLHFINNDLYTLSNQRIHCFIQSDIQLSRENHTLAVGRTLYNEMSHFRHFVRYNRDGFVFVNTENFVILEKDEIHHLRSGGNSFNWALSLNRLDNTFPIDEEPLLVCTDGIIVICTLKNAFLCYQNRRLITVEKIHTNEVTILPMDVIDMKCIGHGCFVFLMRDGTGIACGDPFGTPICERVLLPNGDMIVSFDVFYDNMDYCALFQSGKGDLYAVASSGKKNYTHGNSVLVNTDPYVATETNLVRRMTIMRKLDTLPPGKVKLYAVGNECTFILTTEGLYATGNNEHRMLSIDHEGVKSDGYLPVLMDGKHIKDILTITVDHTMTAILLPNSAICIAGRYTDNMIFDYFQKVTQINDFMDPTKRSKVVVKKRQQKNTSALMCLNCSGGKPRFTDVKKEGMYCSYFCYASTVTQLQ